MPRKLTNEEIDAQKEFMYERTVELISRKGISSIILDDILDAVQMAKGSFYKYYDSKELFLYEVVKKNEGIFFDKMIQATPQIQKSKEKALDVVKNLFSDRDFLFMSLLPEDTEVLLRKMPPSYRKKEEEKSQNNFIAFCQAMDITPTEEFFGTLSYLMLALQAIVSASRDFGKTGRNQAISIMIQSIYGLIIGENENGGK